MRFRRLISNHAFALRSLVLGLCGCLAHAQSPAPAAALRELADQQQWQEIVRQVERNDAAPSAATAYYYGLALAKLGRVEEARQALQRGRKQNPADKNFPLELAGLAFQQHNYDQSKRYAREAVRIDAHDSYANNFLAAVYLLEGNPEAAIKYWNRAGAPRIERIVYDPQPRTRPALLDRAFAFSPASSLTAAEWITTQARLSEMGVFSQQELQLIAREDGNFDAVFRGAERNGLGNGKLGAAIGLLSGLPYQTVYPEYYNIGRSAVNFSSLLRWDAQKRRAFAQLSGPLRHDPKWRYRIDFDVRRENWTISSPDSTLGGLRENRGAVGMEVEEVVGGRFRWSSRLEVFRATFADVLLPATPSRGVVVPNGYTLKHAARASQQLLRLPEYRLNLTANAAGEFGRVFVQPRMSFGRLGAGMHLRWLPRARGDDYETNALVRAGKALGDVPFDQLYTLGVERDNELWLRGHPGTRDGRKGSAPMGRGFVLANFELNKSVYRSTFFDLRLGPTFDLGRVFSPLQPGFDKTLYDPGAQIKLRALGSATLVFSYGKDLRSGGNVFYVTAHRATGSPGS